MTPTQDKSILDLLDTSTFCITNRLQYPECNYDRAAAKRISDKLKKEKQTFQKLKKKRK